MNSTITSKSVLYATIIAIIAVSAFIFPSFAHASYGLYDQYNYGYDPIFVGEMYPSVNVIQPQTVYVAPQPQPVYYPVYYPVPAPVAPLTVTCRSDYTNTQFGGRVLWIAYASGGTGPYSYSWSGEGLSGNSQSSYATYFTPGVKSAYVTVYSGGQVVNQGCSNTVNVYAPVITYPVPVPTPIYQVPVVRGLDIGCFADPSTATVNQPVSWNAEVTGGVGPYTYTWTGSDGLAGYQASVIKYYSKSGSKSAIVSVTSADGKTGTRACSNSVTVKSTNINKKPVKVVTPVVVHQDSTTNTNFSLGNVPWGWVALLVILVLFFTVLYLIFNQKKI